MAGYFYTISDNVILSILAQTIGWTVTNACTKNGMAGSTEVSSRAMFLVSLLLIG